MIIRFRPVGEGRWDIVVGGRKKGSIARRGAKGAVTVVFPQRAPIALVHSVSAFATTLHELA